MAGKRKKSNGEGTVYKRVDKNGKVIGWRGQQTIGNKRKSYSGKTKEEVNNKMTLDRADFNRGVYVPADTITVGEWVEYWLEYKKKPFVKEQTYIVTASRLNNYILPYLSDVKLQDLTTEMIEETYNKVFVNGTRADGKPYSDTTIAYTTSCFRGCLRDAVKAKKLLVNPHDDIKSPKGRAPKKIKAYSPEEQKKIVDFCKDSPKQHDAVIYFLLATGLRVGEAIVLTWDDVDLNKQTIDVNKTYIQINGKFYVQDEPKTKAGNRTITIGKNITAFLKKKKTEMDQTQNIKNLVFPNSKYNYMSEVSLRRRFQKVCAILDIDYHDGLHSLRHTWATRCLEKNAPIKTVSIMLGHDDVLVTMNTYQDVLPNHQEEVAKIMNDLF